MNELVQQVRQISSLGSDGSTDERLRLTMELINSVSKTLTKQTSSKENSVTIIGTVDQLLLMYLNEMLVAVPSTPGDTRNERDCYELSSNILYHFLILLSQPSFTEVHEKTISFIIRLLSMIQSKDSAMFKKLIVELTSCMGDLVAIDEAIYTVGTPPEPELKRILLPDNRRDSSSEVLAVRDADTCLRLQIAVTKILAAFSCQIVFFVADHCQEGAVNVGDIIWAAACYQIEKCDMELKETSLKLLNDMLDVGGLPRALVQSYYIQVLIGFCDLLCEGGCTVEADWQKIEDLVAKNMSILLSVCRRPELSIPDVQEVYQELASGITDCITQYGVNSLHSAKLKEQMFSTLTTVCQRLYKDAYINIILDDQMQNLVDRLIKDIGKSADSRYAVGFLVFVLVWQLEQSTKKKKVPTATLR